MTKFSMKLFDIVVRSRSLDWQRVFRSPSMISLLLNKVQLIIFDGLSREVCIASYLFSKRELSKKSGLLFTAFFIFKASRVIVADGVWW